MGTASKTIIEPPTNISFYCIPFDEFDTVDNAFKEDCLPPGITYFMSRTEVICIMELQGYKSSVIGWWKNHFAVGFVKNIKVEPHGSI